MLSICKTELASNGFRKKLLKTKQQWEETSLYSSAARGFEDRVSGYCRTLGGAISTHCYFEGRKLNSFSILSELSFIVCISR